jgi:hypothetical protein
MNLVVLLPFLIPVTITILLIVMLIKERKYLISNKKNMNSQVESIKKEPSYKRVVRENKRNLDDFVDFSGGIMGI